MRSRNYDIVIIGFGLAGAVAGIESVRRGARTLIIDVAKLAHVGGSSLVSGQGFISTENPEQFAQYARALGTSHPAPITWGESMASVPDWLSRYVAISPRPRVGADFPEAPGAGSIVRWQVDSRSHGNMTQVLQGYALEAGAELMAETRVLHLHRDRGSRIILDASTRSILSRVTSRRGVIIATGGYGTVRHASSSASLGTPHATGDGIRLAFEMGAHSSHRSSFVGPYYGFCLPSTRSAVTPWPLYASNDQLWHDRGVPRLVDRRTGRRLLWPEAHLHGLRRSIKGKYRKQHLRPALLVVTDSELAAGPIVHPWPDGHAQGWARRFGTPWSRTNERELAEGWIRPFTGLARTRAQAPGSGKYFSIPIGPVSLNSLGGLECDESHRVLGRLGHLDGVFAAGEIASRFRAMYQGSANLSECVISGRLAVAAALSRGSG